MLSEITSAQYAEWEAFFRLEPWGGAVEEHRVGLLCATVGNYAGKMLKDGQTLVPSDFFPRRNEKPGKPLSVADKVRAIFGGFRKR